jgi:hypothetical protein
LVYKLLKKLLGDSEVYPKTIFNTGRKDRKLLIVLIKINAIT